MTDKMKRVFVVGMGMASDDLTAAHLDIIRSADILMGGRRHLAQFENLPMAQEIITGRVDETIESIRKHRTDHRVVVLASGDPLFYGIGARIAREVGPDGVIILPNITAIAAAFARIREPWSNAGVISLHGRDNTYELLDAIKHGKTVAVLTDGRHSPQWLAGWLIEKGAGHVEMAVFEKMGMPEEVFGWYAPGQAADRTFAQPNVVIVKPAGDTSAGNVLTLGMAEDDYDHESGLITKSEVRAVTVSKLRLKPGQTLWDLGAGSGSVGIEASVLLGPGRIIAVEQQARRVDQIRENTRRYNVYNHETIQAELPGGLDLLPKPDRVFIGGGGRNLADIVRAAAGCLLPGGRVVVNTVLMDNLARVIHTFESEDMPTEVVQLQVNRSKIMPWSFRMEAVGSPVWIITAEKK